MQNPLLQFLLLITGILIVSLAIVILSDLFHGRKIRLEITSQSRKQALNPRLRWIQIIGYFLWSVCMIFSAIYEVHHKRPKLLTLATSICLLLLNSVNLVLFLRDRRKRRLTQSNVQPTAE
jgi:DMSO reductase anchor subunit